MLCAKIYTISRWRMMHETTNFENLRAPKHTWYIIVSENVISPMSASWVKWMIARKIEQRCFVFASSHCKGCVHGDILISKVVNAERTETCKLGNKTRWNNSVWKYMARGKAMIMRSSEVRDNAHAACRKIEREDEQRDLEGLGKMTNSLSEEKMGAVSTRIHTNGTRSIREMTYV